MAIYYYKYRTKHGTISLAPERIDGEIRHSVIFEDDDLGSYHSPEAAAEDASGGYTWTPPSGIDLGDLGIPEDLEEWEKYRLSALQYNPR